MEGRFLKAFTLAPKQEVICGYQTRPISLRHRLMLTSMGSPFSINGSVPNPADVIIAAKVMSSNDMSMLSDHTPTEHDKKWIKKMVSSEVDYIIECDKVRKAIADQSHWPTFWEKKVADHSHGVPWMLSIVCTLTKGGVPLEDAWTMPESQAIWMATALAISEGAKISVVSDRDVAAMEHLKAIRAEEQALREAKEREEHDECLN